MGSLADFVLADTILIHPPPKGDVGMTKRFSKKYGNKG